MMDLNNRVGMMADYVGEIRARNHQHPDHDTDHWPS